MVDEDYDDILRRGFGLAAATGPLVLSPIPGPDVLAMAAIWTDMIRAIGGRQGVELEEAKVSKAVVATITGILGYLAAVKGFNWVIAKIPGIGMVAGTALNGGINSIYTLVVGLRIVDLFEMNAGSLRDPAALSTYLSELRPKANLSMLHRIFKFFQRWLG